MVELNIHELNNLLLAAKAYGELKAGNNDPRKLHEYLDSWNNVWKPLLERQIQAGLIKEMRQEYMKALRNAYGGLDVRLDPEA